MPLPHSGLEGREKIDYPFTKSSLVCHISSEEGQILLLCFQSIIKRSCQYVSWWFCITLVQELLRIHKEVSSIYYSDSWHWCIYRRQCCFSYRCIRVKLLGVQKEKKSIRHASAQVGRSLSWILLVAAVKACGFLWNFQTVCPFFHPWSQKDKAERLIFIIFFTLHWI